MVAALDCMENALDVTGIQKLIPHRYPFLLIDRVLDYKPLSYVKALKNVTSTEPLLQGHFPGNPVMPGVLMVEALAQASAILGQVSTDKDCQTCLLTEVSDSRFRRVVVPGDTLMLEVRLIKGRKDFWWFEGEATVDGEIAAEVKFTAKLS